MLYDCNKYFKGLYLLKITVPAGFEPATSDLTGLRNNRTIQWDQCDCFTSENRSTD